MMPCHNLYTAHFARVETELMALGNHNLDAKLYFYLFNRIWGKSPSAADWFRKAAITPINMINLFHFMGDYFALSGYIDDSE